MRDVVLANVLAMDCGVADGRPINIGRGANVSVNWIAAAFGGPTVSTPARPYDVRHTLADSTEARKTLGWVPQVTIEEGLAELIKLAGL